MNRPRGSRAFVVLSFGLLLLAGIGRVVAAPVPALVGTPLPGNPPAPTFTLTDQLSHRYSLDSSRGKVVVLTFLYTHCTDVCPFIAAKLRDVVQLLGDDAKSVDIVVISVDPERDTPAVLASYSNQFSMQGRWHFVTGTESQLSPLWKAYHIDVEVDKDEIAVYDANAVKELESKGLRNGMSDSDVGLALETIGKFGGGYEIDHGTPIYLIDKTGHMRVVLDENAAPSDIVADARALTS